MVLTPRLELADLPPQGRMFPGLPQVSIFMTNRSVPLPEVLDTVRC
jgi:hypothetical protein